MSLKIQGELEIDQERGVIWFHSTEVGCTLLRICRLPKPIPDPTEPDFGLLDITHMVGASWRAK